MVRHRFTRFACLMLLAPLCGWAGTPRHVARYRSGETIAFHRAAELRRGVNLSGWYGGWGHYSPQHIATWTTPADFAFLHSIGVQYVRLCIDPVQLTMGGYDSASSTAALARLDRSIDEILAAKLNVMIDIFPRSDYKRALLTPAGKQSFLDLWKFLAVHFAARDPDRVFFDLLNEPEVTDAAKWNAIQADVVKAIRSVDEQHTLIATGDRYAGIDELVQVAPLHDDNIIYTFHFYEPFPFTHQGATWSSPAFVHLKDVPYPARAAEITPLIAAATDPGARAALVQYAGQHWDEAVIRHRLLRARLWANKHHVPVICNEFGAFRDTIPDSARARFLHDVRTALEATHMYWAVWDYRGNFGIVTRTPSGEIVPDAKVIHALGFGGAMPPGTQQDSSLN